LRQSSLIEPVDRLHLGGSNLANAYQALKNEKSAEHWRTTMDYVRLGLGEDVESINLRADPGGGQIALMLKRKGVDQPEPAASLSDGMLGYLAFVAMLRLEAPTSLLMFDEPEVHLHPRLIQRVVGFFEAMSERTNVVICTHSDRLLDVLSNPAEAAVLLDLNAARETTLTRPNPEQLATWLESYNGLGALRSAGLEQVVFDEAES
jgi:predicted ATPase